MRNKPHRERRRTFLGIATHEQRNYSIPKDGKDLHDDAEGTPPSTISRVRRSTISVAPSRMKKDAEKNLSWYALRPPDSTNVVFKSLGPKGANATLKASAAIFSVPSLQTKKDQWTLECNVLANQQIIWEFHAYPAANIDFSLNFRINVDSNVVIFPSTQASNAPNAGSLQQVEGGTYSFQFSSRNIIGYTDIWCVVRCPKAEREDQEQRRKYVRASRPIVISHAFADSKYLASSTPSTRAYFSSDSSSQVRMWKRFIGDERVTGESPVYIEANGKFLSISQVQANKLFFSSVKAEDATLFYIRGIHPSEELAMNKQFELAVVKSDGEYIVCTSLEKNARENELCLTLVREARQDSQEKKFENVRRVTFVASPLTSSRYHGSSDAKDPVFRERRLTNLGNDISGKLWLERAISLGILDTLSSSAEDEIAWIQQLERMKSLQTSPKNDHSNKIKNDTKNGFDTVDETSDKQMENDILEYIFGKGAIKGGENGLNEDGQTIEEEGRKERLNHVLLSIDLIALDSSCTVEDILSVLQAHFEKDSDLHDDILVLKGLWKETNNFKKSHEVDCDNAEKFGTNRSFLDWTDKVSSLSECFAQYDRKLCNTILSPSSLTSRIKNDTGNRNVKQDYINKKHDLSYDRRVRIAWLQNGILQEENAVDRAIVIELIISLAMGSKKLNNYKMLLCCHDALISMPILRLGKSWGLVREHFHNEFAMLRILCSPFENYRTLRCIMEKKDSFIPCFAPLQNSINHISHLPSIWIIENGDGMKKQDLQDSETTDSNNDLKPTIKNINWVKYRLYHDVIAQQYESSERCFENLPLYLVERRENRKGNEGHILSSISGTQSLEHVEVSKPTGKSLLLDVENLALTTVIEEDVILQRSKQLECIKVGKQNILKSINDVANDVASLIIPKQNFFLPYKRKRNFVGVTLLHEVPIFIEIAVETIFCSASKKFLEKFEDTFSSKFINGHSFNVLIKHCSDNIIALSDHVMENYRSELWSKLGDELEELHVRKSVAKIVLGRTQLRLWATVRRDNVIADENHMRCVIKMKETLSDEVLWNLCTDSINDEEALPFLSSWKSAINALNNIQHTNDPYDKLQFVRNVFQAIEQEAKENSMKPLTADDLMPIILFVVCRSTLPYKWSTLKFMEPFIEMVHSFGGSFSGFNSFCIANFEMAMIISDAYPNFYKQKSLSLSRQTSSSSFYAGELSPRESSTGNIDGVKFGDGLNDNTAATSNILDIPVDLTVDSGKGEQMAKPSHSEETNNMVVHGIVKRTEGEKINMKELPFVD
jgi:hypothetical protein